MAAQLEQVANAALAETEAPGQKLLLQVTAEQLEATQTALQQAVLATAEAEQQARRAASQEALTRQELEQAEQREKALGRRLDSLLSKASEPSLLQLPPPSKGVDLTAQHHILQLNFRHVQSELQRKTLAAEGLVEQRGVLLEQLNSLQSAQREQQRRLRTENSQLRQEAHKAVSALRSRLTAHVEELEGLRMGSASISGNEERAAQAAAEMAVRSKVGAAVRIGAARGLHRRASAQLSVAEMACKELREALAVSERGLQAGNERAVQLESCLAAERERVSALEGDVSAMAAGRGLAEETCTALMAELADAREGAAAKSVEHVAAAEEAARELGERAATIHSLEARLVDAEREAAAAKGRAAERDAECRRTAQEAAEAAAAAANAAAREELASTEAASQRTAREELLAAHEELVKQLEEAHEAHRALRLETRRQLEDSSERSRALEEHLAREQQARQDSVQEVHELRRAGGQVGDLEQQLHQSRDASAAQRAEVASLQVQLEQLRGSLAGATQREAELEQQAHTAEERASRATRELQGAAAHRVEQQAQSRSQHAELQAQLQTQMQASRTEWLEREHELGRRNAQLESECAGLRSQLRAQSEQAAAQLAEWRAKAARELAEEHSRSTRELTARGLSTDPQPLSPLTPPPLSLRPASPSPGAGATSSTDADQLRAQLQKRESIAVELRQLAESYKAKSDRLAQQLTEERQQAASQGELWKQQLQSLRTRSRADKERARELEERIRAMRREAAAASATGDDAPPQPWTTPAPRGSEREVHSIDSSRSTPASGAKGLRGVKGKVLSTAVSLDSTVDRALDRVDGFVKNLSRRTTSHFTPVSTEGD
jgi:hypothetical protein